MRKNKGTRISTPLQRQATARNWYIFKLRGCISKLKLIHSRVPSQVAKIAATQLVITYNAELTRVIAMSTLEFTQYARTNTLIDF